MESSKGGVKTVPLLADKRLMGFLRWFYVLNRGLQRSAKAALVWESFTSDFWITVSLVQKGTGCGFFLMGFYGLKRA